ncbi:N-acetylglucosaminylphosphatidylinositol deacetylase [Strigomonas culicis]|nr:N-acetylglucosaminylphosphatidylinositol deacetylase [Strigomonas culicis]|eukprot:EPY27913.1 N-acetylglucosaminylphosphatidylinositol deacetylase [Strigomonas culicis]
MFFAPTLHLLQQQHIPTHFLCLSTGNADGLGPVRAKELLDSAAYFGIAPRNVKVVDHPQLQDGMQERWAPALVRQEVAQYLRKAGSISTIITFDARGVSAHPNHIAVHEGVKAFKESLPPGLHYLQLRTRPLHLKYLGLTALGGYLTRGVATRDRRRDFVVVMPPASVLRSWCAMMKHRSQLRWFRYLFLTFSTYTYFNELKAM